MDVAQPGLPEGKETQTQPLPEQEATNNQTGQISEPGVKGTPLSGELEVAFPGQVIPTAGGGIIASTFNDIINWARSNSLWPLTFATSCCGIEMMSVASAKYDFSRFGFEVARATPRQADVIIIAGTIVNKMGPVLKRLYDQMADPKYVIAMGACAISGGPFFYNTYSVVKGADHIIPVDVYIPGCPPRPEALLHALISLQEKIKSGLTREQIRTEKNQL
jgi:NADH-quinone oxidoreductase subunit B